MLIHISQKGLIIPFPHFQNKALDPKTRSSIEQLHFLIHFPINFVLTEVILNYKGAGSFHTHRKTMKELGALAVLGVREQPNLAQNLVTHRH